MKKELPELEADIDKKIDLAVIQDRSITIRGSLIQVEETLVLAILMVILVVYIFLNSFRAALIPAVVVPVSLAGTFGIMYLAGFSLDNFSLMAMTIATGFVVDDAIVVMENSTRHIEHGMQPMQAALLGAREVGFTVVSMSLSLVAVFLPFQFLGGIPGRLFKEFTVTLSVAILISLIVSLTTTPMMCSRLLGRDGHKKPNAFARGFNSSFESMREGYERTLGFALNHPLLMMLSLVATIVLNVYLYAAIPKGFMPQQDTGQLQGGMRGDATASFEMIKGKLQQVTKIIQSDPAVDTVAGSVGGGGFGNGGGASANFNVTLKPLSQRKASADQVIARLRPKLNKVDGVMTFLQAVQDLGNGGGGRSANSQYQYTLLGDDLTELRDWTQKLKLALQDVPEVTDVDTDLQAGGLQTDLIVDRDAAARLGLNESIIDSALGNSFTQATTSTIYNPFNPQQYHVVMEVAPEYSTNPQVLRDMFLSTSGGQISGTQATQAVAGTTSFKGKTSTAASAIAQDAARNRSSNSLANAGRGNTSTGAAISLSAEHVVPFAAFSHFSTSTTPTTVNHTGTSISQSFSYNLPEGVALSVGMGAIERTMAQIHMPISIHGSAYGTAQLFQQSTGNMPVIIIAAILAIYVVLGVLYESFTQPLTIISTLPSAGLGALLALMLTNTELSLVAFLGIMLLIGIVKKNAIMMVDFALGRRAQPRAGVARCHCAGLLAAVPAHHDDDLRGHRRRLAAGTGLRRRHRAAPPAGYLDRGRAHRQPAADALHHPGGVSVHPPHRCQEPCPQTAAAARSGKPCRRRRDLTAQPRPMKGILVAMRVMNWTLADNGSLAMPSTACATCSTSINGSGVALAFASWSASSVRALPMSIWPQAMSYSRPSSEVDLVSPVMACLVAV